MNKSKKEQVLIIALLGIIAAIKYFWFVPQSLFEADQEYLALSGKQILQGDFTLIGAPTSVGGMFIGPLYNYIVAFFLWIFGGNPLVINGLSDMWMTLTIAGLYLVGNRLYSQKAGMFAAMIGLLSTRFIDQSEVPPLLYPLPLISLLILFVLSSAYAKKAKSVMIGALIGLSLNLHFSGIFFIPLLLATHWWGLVSLLFFLFPLLLFEVRNNFFITQHITQFFALANSSASPIDFRIHTYLSSLVNLFYPIRFNNISVLFFVFLCLLLLRTKKYWEFLLLIIPLLFFLSYSGHLLPYYAISAWPISILIAGFFLSKFWNMNRGISFLILILLSWYSIKNYHLWSSWSSGRSIDKKIAALQFIKKTSSGKAMYLSKTIEPAADFGFMYLIGYVGVKSTGNVKDPNYTIVAPFNWKGIQPDVRFGDFGVVLPKTENNEQ